MSSRLNVKAAVWGGIVAGLVFIIVEMALVALVQGQSPWGPPRMMAAMVMGKGVLPPPATFDAGIAMIAMVVHMMLSILLGFVFGFAASAMRLGLAAILAAGVAFGLIVYFVDFYIFTAVFPWFAMGRGPINIFAHALFGFVLAWVYHAIASRAEVDEHEAPGATAMHS